MNRLSKLGFRVARADETLLFLLGLFSTWQIVQVAGFSVSTLLTVLVAGYLVFTREPAIRKDWLLFCLLISYAVTTVLSLFLEIPSGYKKTALINFIQWILVFVVVMYTTQHQSSQLASTFLRGFSWSCRIQLIWCFLQILLYKLTHVDLNQLIFKDLLSMVTEASQFRDGSLVCTGLHWHAANMIPILIFLYFSHSSVFIKLACIVAVYFTKNATAMIGIFICVGLDCLLFAKQTLIDRQGALKRKIAAYCMLAFSAFVVLAPIIFPKIWSMVEYLLLRLYQIQNPTEGNESSATHFAYYKYLPNILCNLSAPEILFGSGIHTSGYRFTQFLSQYPDLIWMVESDPVNLILSCGVVGFFLHYTLVLRTIHCLSKTANGKKYAWWMLILIPCGFVYNNQFLWVVLVEIMLYRQLSTDSSCNT